ncbi:MAG: aspartate kinase [Candidatus Diapherotrites archaeon]|nr:aspartate kinase [Candidatus Diapherotrites archaeon]
MAIVFKFGGTSMGSAENLKTISQIIGKKLNQKPVIIVSAIAGVTDLLLDSLKNKQSFEIIKQKHLHLLTEAKLDSNLLNAEFQELKELLDAVHALRKAQSKVADSEKLADNVISFGERMAAKILAEVLNQKGISAKSFCSWDLGLTTDSNFGNAKPLKESFSKIKQKISKLKIVPVVTGFIGKDRHGEITTLGRGGSDYSASIFAYALTASALEIWKDVSGLYSADPRFIPNAKKIENIAFDEAAELSYFGAKVLHPKTIILPLQKNIPVKILNTFRPKDKGTTIFANSKKVSQGAKAISLKKNMTLIDLHSPEMIDQHGFMAFLFEVFRDEKISVDVITTSTANVTVVVDKPNPVNLQNAVKKLSKLFTVTVKPSLSALCIVGKGLAENGKVTSTILKTLSEKRIPIEVVSIGASKLNMTLVLQEKYGIKAMQILHKKLIE